MGQEKRIFVSEHKEFLKELALVCLPALITSLPELIKALRGSVSDSPKEENIDKNSSSESFSYFIRSCRTKK